MRRRRNTTKTGSPRPAGQRRAVQEGLSSSERTAQFLKHVLKGDALLRATLIEGLLSALQSSLRLLGSIQDTDELLKQTLQEGLQAVGATRGVIALIDYHRGEIYIKCAAGRGWTEEMLAARAKLGGRPGDSIAGWVATTGKPYLCGDVTKDPYYFPLFADTRSELAVPLIGRNSKVIGVLAIESKRYDAFSPADQELLTALANVAAVAMSIADYDRRERALIELGKELAAAADIEGLLHKVTAVAMEILNADDSSLFLIDPDSDRLILKASNGRLRMHVGEAAYRVGEGLTGWVAEQNETACVPDLQADPRRGGTIYREFPGEEIGPFLAVPIRGRSRVLGVLRVVRRKVPDSSYSNPFREDDEELLTMLASQVGAALERAELQERLIHTERMAAWGEMSARTAHMIGNKIFGLKGAIKELVLGLPPEEPTDDRLKLFQGIERSIFEIEELIHEFRDFVRASQLTVKPVDLTQLLQGLVDEHAKTKEGVQVLFKGRGSRLMIQGDESRLRRCFGELIENAMHFLSKGGVITISANALNRKEQGKWVKVVVKDNGPGIPEGDKELIFQPFHTSRAQGLGLGLAIVKSIIEAHGGSIEEQGVPGKGAEFVILLPKLKEGETIGTGSGC